MYVGRRRATVQVSAKINYRRRENYVLLFILLQL